MAEWLFGLISPVLNLLWSEHPFTQFSIGFVLACGLLTYFTIYLPLRVDLWRKRRTRKKLEKELAQDQSDLHARRDTLTKVLSESKISRNAQDFFFRWNNSKNDLDRSPVRFASTYQERPLMPTGWRRSLTSSIPGIFLALGILGTFIGLTLALPDSSDIGVSPQKINEQVTSLTRSLSLAFRTSLWGILLSIFFVVLLRRLEGGYELEEEKLDLVIHEFFPWISEPELAARAIEEQVSNTTKLQTALSDVSMSLENAITSGLERIEQSTSSAANVVSQELIQQLGQTLQEGVGAHVEALRSAIKQTTKVQEEIGVSLALAFEEIRKATEAHDATASSLDRAATSVTSAADRLSSTTDEFSPAVEKLAVTSEALKSTSGSMEKVQESAASAVEAVKASLEDATASLEQQRALVEGTMTEMQNALQRLSEGLSDDLVSALQSVDGVLGGSISRLSGTVHESNQTLDLVGPLVGKVLEAAQAIQSSTGTLAPQVESMAISMKEGLEPISVAIADLKHVNGSFVSQLQVVQKLFEESSSERSENSQLDGTEVKQLAKHISLLSRAILSNKNEPSQNPEVSDQETEHRRSAGKISSQEGASNSIKRSEPINVERSRSEISTQASQSQAAQSEEASTPTRKRWWQK